MNVSFCINPVVPVKYVFIHYALFSQLWVFKVIFTAKKLSIRYLISLTKKYLLLLESLQSVGEEEEDSGRAVIAVILSSSDHAHPNINNTNHVAL